MDKWQASFLGLKQLPRELSDFEIQAFFMFNVAERLSIEARRQAALKLGLALQIGFLRMSGRLLNAVRIVPPTLWHHLGEQLGVTAPDLASLKALYQRPKTLFEHQQLACELLGFRSLADAQRRALVRVLRRELTHTMLFAYANELHGDILIIHRQYQAAQHSLEESYQLFVAERGATNLSTLSGLSALCNLYALTHQLEKASLCAQQGYDSSRSAYGEHDLMTLSMLANFGEAQFGLGTYATAARTLGSAHAGLERSVGEDNYMTQNTDYYLARCLLQLHHANQAAVYVQNLNAKTIADSEPGAPWALRLQLLHGMVLLNQGKRSEALPLLLQVNQLHDDADPTDTIIAEARQALRSAGIRTEPPVTVTPTDSNKKSKTYAPKATT